METLQTSASFQPQSAALEVVPVEQLLQVTPIGGRGFAHHRLPMLPAHLPGRLEFGCIKLFASETIPAGRGYALHEHQNGEIISLVLEGSVLHENTVNPTALIPAESVAVISAGRGIRHAEFAGENAACRIVQIVLEPRSIDSEPRAADAVIPRVERRSKFRVLASGRACDADRGVLYIDQDAALSSCVFEAGMTRQYQVERGRIAYLMTTDAPIHVNGRSVAPNARVLVHRDCTLEIAASAETEVLLLDMRGA